MVACTCMAIVFMCIPTSHVDMYDPPSCWTIIPSSATSSMVYAAYGEKVYMIDNITCKEKVCMPVCVCMCMCVCVCVFISLHFHLGST